MERGGERLTNEGRSCRGCLGSYYVRKTECPGEGMVGEEWEGVRVVAV